MAGRLHVVGQHGLRIAVGDEHVGADDLGAVTGAYPQQFGRTSDQG